MIKTLKVDNFKSLVKFSIDFHENNVIVGNNATGKSSILQAIDFLCSSVKEDFRIILERRGWKVENIKSKLSSPKNNKIHFLTTFVLEVEKEQCEFEWEMILLANKSRNEITTYFERITIDNKDILSYHFNHGGNVRLNDENELFMPLPAGLSFSSSVMKVIRDTESISKQLRVFMQFLENSLSFELLSPNEMRLSSRGNAESIGISGKNLPSFIKRMNEQQKNSFMKKLTEVLGDRIQQVDAETKGKPGWTQINIKEQFTNQFLTINSKEMSDGMLRLLAFVAISEIQTPEAVVLLDEVENGINVDYAKSLMDVMQKMYKEKRHQLIMTTHSTVFLDYIKPENIIFLYRDSEGCTRSVHIFEDPYFREKLEYMWPGEVLLSMAQKELVEKVLAIQGE